MVQRLRVHLAMQGKPVQVLVQEDSTCCGATATREATATQSSQTATRSSHTTTWSSHTVTKSGPCYHQQRKTVRSNKDPVQPKIIKFLKKETSLKKKKNQPTQAHSQGKKPAGQPGGCASLWAPTVSGMHFKLLQVWLNSIILKVQQIQLWCGY